MTFYLDPIPLARREGAVAAMVAGDLPGFLIRASSNEYHLDLVWRNALELQARGLYEAALVLALTSTRTNHLRWPMRELRAMLQAGNPEKLRAAGDALPGSGPFQVYRGVAGHGSKRRPRGLSWTLDVELARWFARRFSLESPAVWSGEVAAGDVIVYIDGREEKEVIALPETIKRRRRIEPLT